MNPKPFQVGTLLEDTGKLGVIYRIVEAGSLNTLIPLIDWRVNYEIYYFDGTITMMGENTLMRLIKTGKVNILDEKMNMSAQLSGAAAVV
jgi:hypothetical protein